jgi:hypothetical protein
MSLHEEALHTSGRRCQNFTNFGRAFIDVVGYISEEIHQPAILALRADSPPTRGRRSIGSGGESSSTPTSVAGNAEIGRASCRERVSYTFCYIIPQIFI